MADFEPRLFMRRLEELPEARVCAFPAEYSEYLKEKVFDPLKKESVVHLGSLDWSAFGLAQVTPQDYGRQYDRIAEGWALALNRKLQSIQPTARSIRKFF